MKVGMWEDFKCSLSYGNIVFQFWRFPSPHYSTSGELFCVIQKVANAFPSSVFRSPRNSTSLRCFGRRSGFHRGCCGGVLRNSLILSIELIRSGGDLIVIAVLYLIALTLGVSIVGIGWRLSTWDFWKTVFVLDPLAQDDLGIAHD